MHFTRMRGMVCAAHTYREPYMDMQSLQAAPQRAHNERTACIPSDKHCTVPCMTYHVCSVCSMLCSKHTHKHRTRLRRRGRLTRTGTAPRPRLSWWRRRRSGARPAAGAGRERAATWGRASRRPRCRPRWVAGWECAGYLRRGFFVFGGSVCVVGRGAGCCLVVAHVGDPWRFRVCWVFVCGLGREQAHAIADGHMMSGSGTAPTAQSLTEHAALTYGNFADYDLLCGFANCASLAARAPLLRSTRRLRRGGRRRRGGLRARPPPRHCPRPSASPWSWWVLAFLFWVFVVGGRLHMPCSCVASGFAALPGLSVLRVSQCFIAGGKDVHRILCSMYQWTHWMRSM